MSRVRRSPTAPAHFGPEDHLYAALLARMADDCSAGGVTREIFDGWRTHRRA